MTFRSVYLFLFGTLAVGDLLVKAKRPLVIIPIARLICEDDSKSSQRFALLAAHEESIIRFVFCSDSVLTELLCLNLF